MSVFIGAYRIKAFFRDLSKADFCTTEVCSIDISGATLIEDDLIKFIANRLDNPRNAFLHRQSGTTLKNAKGADLTSTTLSVANLSGITLIGACLTQIIIGSMTLNYAVVDGEKIIARCKVNDSTYAYGVGLDSARILELLGSELKKNIRKKYWMDQYPHHFDRKSILRYIKSMPRYLRKLSTI